ncbi:MAG: carboxypeptidase M32 [Phycisphaerales bacterium]|nr:MAG: carboxypeptidase M32 [Phycisphaerales bacterium]
MTDAYTKLMERVKDIGRLSCVEQLLDWDQQVYMPSGGANARAELSALIAGMAHEKLVADETGTLLGDVQTVEGDFVVETNMRETRRAFERASKVPTELVKEIAYTSALTKEAWAKAREESDFGKFAPHLEKLLDLKKQVAEHIGYETEAYDALMDEFEPGAEAAEIENVFSNLRSATVALLERLGSSTTKPDRSILTRHFPRAQQEVLSRRMSESLGFDYKSGRIDVTVHPFCTTIGGPSDIRITTRYMENFLSGALFGTLHETGHALYEQGLPAEHLFTPMGQYVSLGIHESQSRMWENLVGRSRPFWQCHWEQVKAMFPEALGDVSLDEFYGAINAVRPSFIRVEADELTYNMHIILRFEIERALFTGELAVVDIPAAWNDKMQELLGVTPPNDREGCLQDIHWSMGIFGYFPTYALGNLYAAQFFAKAKEDIPDLFERIAGNDHTPLLDWLRANIHQHGRRYRANELVEVVTGKPLSIAPFVDYATEKFSAIYGV